jgi:uncharacterized protein
MSNSYLNIATQGKNQWWRYLCGITLSLLFVSILGSLVYLIVAFAIVGTADDSVLRTFINSKSVSNFVASNIPFAFWFAGTVLAVRWFHRRSAWSLFNSRETINWSRLSYGFMVWFAIGMVSSVIYLLLKPQDFQFHFNINEWPILFFTAMIMTSIQTSAEEIFFRGYLLQGMSLLTRQPIVLVVLNGILFAIPHLGNPEMARDSFILGALNYFAIGVFLAYITLKDHGLELALGLHAANNISHIFFTTSDSALEVPALWTSKPPTMLTELIYLLVSIAICYYFFFQKRLWS